MIVARVVGIVRSDPMLRIDGLVSPITVSVKLLIIYVQNSSLYTC